MGTAAPHATPHAAAPASATPIQCGRGVLGQRPAVTNKLWQRPEQPPEELSKNCRHHAAQRSSELRVTSADSRSAESNFRWTLPKLGFLHYRIHPKISRNSILNRGPWGPGALGFAIGRRWSQRLDAGRRPPKPVCEKLFW